MSNNTFNVFWVTTLPESLEPSSFYLVKKDESDIQVVITGKDSVGRIVNTKPDLSVYIKSINEQKPNEQGNVTLDFLTQDSISNFITSDQLNEAIEGITIPVDTNKLTIPTNVTITDSIPTKTPGTVLKVTNNKTIGNVIYSPGDLLLYQSEDNNPIHIKNKHIEAESVSSDEFESYIGKNKYVVKKIIKELNVLNSEGTTKEVKQTQVNELYYFDNEGNSHKLSDIVEKYNIDNKEYTIKEIGGFVCQSYSNSLLLTTSDAKLNISYVSDNTYASEETSFESSYQDPNRYEFREFTYYGSSKSLHRGIDSVMMGSANVYSTTSSVILFNKSPNDDTETVYENSVVIGKPINHYSISSDKKKGTILSVSIGSGISNPWLGLGNTIVGSFSGFMDARSQKLTAFNEIFGCCTSYGISNQAAGVGNTILGSFAPFAPPKAPHTAVNDHTTIKGSHNSHKLIIQNNAHLVKLQQGDNTEWHTLKPLENIKYDDISKLGKLKMDPYKTFPFQESKSVMPLIYGDFKDKWFSINGIFYINVDNNPVEDSYSNINHLATFDPVGKLTRVDKIKFIKDILTSPLTDFNGTDRMNIFKKINPPLIQVNTYPLGFWSPRTCGTPTNPITELQWATQSDGGIIGTQCKMVIHFKGSTLGSNENISWINPDAFVPNKLCRLAMDYYSPNTIVGFIIMDEE